MVNMWSERSRDNCLLANIGTSLFAGIRWLLCLSCVVALLVIVVPASRAAGSADESYATGKQLYATDHYDDAIPELKQFLADFPDDARVCDALLTLGSCYKALKQWNEAIKDFEQVTTRATGTEQVELRANAYYQLADSHLLLAESLSETQGQTHAYEEAAKDYRACLKLAAKSDLQVSAQFYLGESLYRLGRFTEALAEYRKVPEIAPQDELVPWARYSMGNILLRQKHYSEAITALEAVLTQSKDPKICAGTTCLLGEAYAGRAGQQKDEAAKNKDLDQALRLLTGVLGNAVLDPLSRQQVLLDQAQIYTDRQQYDKAEAAFTSLLGELEPNSPLALEVHGKRGDMYYNAQRYREAASDYALLADSNAPAADVTPALYYLGNSSYEPRGAGERSRGLSPGGERLPPLSRRHADTGESDARHAAAGVLPGKSLRAG